MPLNDGYDYREQLGPRADGMTLLAYLCRYYSHSSEEEWLERIATGQLTVDGVAALPHDILHRGALLVWRRSPWVEPAAPTDVAILYEDDHILAVAKPAGLPTMPGANFLVSTLLYQVRRMVPEASPLHRLGRWTSGLVLCARTPEAAVELTRQWRGRGVGKRYRALASGTPSWEELTIDTPIGPVEHPLLGTIHAATPSGKPSLSRVTVLERRPDGSFLCDVAIDTGRPHQIRIHLAASGHPLLGDPLYEAGGVPAADSRALPGDPGYLLHSAELRFLHPADGRPMTIRCEPPPLLRCSGDTPVSVVETSPEA